MTAMSGEQPPAARANGLALQPAIQLAVSLTLAGLFFLPLASGGYSGAGYLVALVLLPIALLLTWTAWRLLPRMGQVVLLCYLLGLFTLPVLVQEGRELWAWILPLPLVWCLAWLVQSVLDDGDRVPELAAYGAGLVALLGLIFWLAGGDSAARLSGVFGLPNAFAGYLLLAWPLALLKLRKAEGRWRRILLGSSLLAVLLALVFTYSRAAWLVFAVQLLLVTGLLLTARRRSAAGSSEPLSWHWPTAGIVTICVLLLAFLAPVREVLSRTLEFQGYSMQGRLRFWQAALEIWRDNPWLGIGPGNFGYVYPQYQRDPWWYSVDPHSWPLQLLCELGLPGLCILLGILVGTTLWVRRVHRQLGGVEGALLIAAVIGSIVHAAVDFDYTFPATTALLGCVLAYGSWRAVKASTDDSAPVLPRESPLPGALRWTLGGMLLLTAAFGALFAAERFSLDRLRDTPGLPPRVQLELLTQAMQVNPLNHTTHYRLAALRAAPGGRPELRQTARQEVERSLALNPRYTLAWALRGLLAGSPADGEADLQRAIELDPYNYPQHYFYWANAAVSDEERRARLLLCLERIPVLEPVTARDIRNDWIGLNPVFARIYYELARLEPDQRKAETYRQLGARFEVEAQRQREKTPAGDTA